VTQAQVEKLNSQTEPSYVHSQLLYINSLPFSVLKLIRKALTPWIEQLSKYHSVDSEVLSLKLTFSSTHHPWQVSDSVGYGAALTTLSNTFLASNVKYG